MALHQRGDVAPLITLLGVLSCVAAAGLDSNFMKNSLRRAGGGRHVVDADVSDEAVLEEIFGICGFTHVLHLAAQAGV
eukprot:1176244-Prorocentrum_minimum.AAC.4